MTNSHDIRGLRIKPTFVNPFTTNNMTLRAKYMVDNPYT